MPRIRFSVRCALRVAIHFIATGNRPGLDVERFRDKGRARTEKGGRVVPRSEFQQSHHQMRASARGVVARSCNQLSAVAKLSPVGAYRISRGGEG